METCDKNVDDADADAEVDVVTAAVAPGVPLENRDGNDNLAVKTIAMESVAVPPARPAIETVFATAVISHSSSSQVTNDEINYLLRIIRSKEHLNQNITSVDLGSVQSYKENGNKFEHKIQLMVHVKTINLWENSRSYIHHHLRKDIWNLRDGKEVALRRIYQKT